MIHRRPALAAFVAVVSCITCQAQDVRITNMADYGRVQWVDVALPAGDGAALPDLCRLDPAGFIAWKGARVGLHSRMFHVLARLGPRETINGRLVGVQSFPAPGVPHVPSDWVADDFLATIPVPSLIAAGREHRFTLTEWREVESGSARRVLHLRGRIEDMPLVCEQWLYVYSGQDLVRYEMTLTHSDPRSAELSCSFDLLWHETGELATTDFRTLTTLGPRYVQTGIVNHPSYRRWCQVLSGTRTMGRGEQLFFSGWVLGAPTAGMLLRPTVVQAGPMSAEISVGDRVSTLYAASEPAVGVYTGWDGKWLAFGMVPELPAGSTNQGWDDANASAAGFLEYRETPRDLYAQRPRGLNRSAGSTGAQEDFGATKGALAVTVGDPRLLHELWYSAYEMFARPFHHREVDCSPLLASNHDRMRTWSQLLNCRTTHDTIGMVCPLPYSWPDNGWSGMDDQHRSQNNFNALLALTGSHALRGALKDLLEIDLLQDPNRIDSPRAEGRLMMAWTNMFLLLDDPGDRANLWQHMSERIDVALQIWPGGRFLGDPTRPIRALAVGRDTSFRDPGGVQIPAIIVWEHSIAAMGYFAVWRWSGDPRFRLLAAELSRLVVERCIYEHQGHWTACTAVRYLQGDDEGRALPASSYYPGSPDIHVGISFWTWIYPAVLVCRALHQDDPALVARCDAIVAGMGAPNSWQRSEWWAVMPR